MRLFRVLAFLFCSISVLSGCETSGAGLGDSGFQSEERISIEALSTSAQNNIVCIPILAQCGCTIGGPEPEDSCKGMVDLCDLIGTGPPKCDANNFCTCDVIVFEPD